MVRSYTAELIQGYRQLLEQRVAEGMQPSLLTFMFRQLRPSRHASRSLQMQEAVHRVFKTLVTRVVRKPRSHPERLPVLIGCADLPVYKRNKLQWIDVARNDGLHYHAILLMPSKCRLRTSVVTHFDEKYRLYVHGPFWSLEPDKGTGTLLLSDTRSLIRIDVPRAVTRPSPKSARRRPKPAPRIIEKIAFQTSGSISLDRSGRFVATCNERQLRIFDLRTMEIVAEVADVGTCAAPRLGFLGNDPQWTSSGLWLAGEPFIFEPADFLSRACARLNAAGKNIALSWTGGKVTPCPGWWWQ